MNRLKKIIKLGLIIFIILVCAIGFAEMFFNVLYDGSSSVDVCLDLGGSWDYTLKKCQHK